MPRIGASEWLTLTAIAAVGGVFHLVPDNQTQTGIELEQRAFNWQATTRLAVSDSTMIVDDIQLAGTWVCKQRLTSSEFQFTPTGRGEFLVDFSTHGCLGRCELRRSATLSVGTIRLDGAVAEYRPRTYDRLYAVRAGGVEYLLPEDSVPMFERELASPEGAWEFYVFRRDRNSSALDDASAPSTDGPLRD